MRQYKAFDNYFLSTPPEPGELWRNELQLLYDTMKLAVTDLIAIDGQYFDVHDALADSRDSSFNASEAEVILGLRKLAYGTVIPQYLKYHLAFFSSVVQLHPGTKLGDGERTALVSSIPCTYRALIDTIRVAHEQDMGRILETLPFEFALPELIHDRVRSFDRHMRCLQYPRTRGPACTDYSAALGDCLLFEKSWSELPPEQAFFIPVDDPFCAEHYPGSLSSYPGRIRFLEETLGKIDLVQLRESHLVTLLTKTG